MRIDRRRLFVVALGLAAFALPGLRSVIAEEPAGPALVVGGAVEHPLKLALADLLKMPRTSVRAAEHDGQQVTYEGVLLSEILKAAGAPLGEKLRGQVLTNYVLAKAKDGYQVLFALPELDP